jgi:ribosomal protein S4E
LLKGEKLFLKEISEKDAFTKVFKIIGKKVLNRGKIQFNLSGGRNFISDIKAGVNDSLLWDLKEDKPLKHLLLKENARVFIIAGKNAGLEGVMVKRDDENLNVKIQDKISKILVRSVWVIG